MRLLALAKSAFIRAAILVTCLGVFACGDRSATVITGVSEVNLGPPGEESKSSIGAVFGTAVRQTISGTSVTDAPFYTFILVIDESALAGLPGPSEGKGFDDQRTNTAEFTSSVTDTDGKKHAWTWRLEFNNKRLRLGDKWYSLSDGDVIVAKLNASGDINVYGQYRNMVPYDPSLRNTVHALAEKYPKVLEAVSQPIFALTNCAM